MSSFQIIDTNTVTASGAFGSEYTIARRPEGGFRVWCVNASSQAYRRGFPTPRDFSSLQEVEAAYKGLRGVSGAFLAEVTTNVL